MNQLKLYLCIVAVLELLALQASAAVVVQPNAPGTQILAAREVRRYVYLRTGMLLPITEKLPNRGEAIVIARDESLQPQQYTLKAKTDNGRKLLTITGGSDTACLYGVYTFAEKLGVRFYLHGDVIPDEKINFALPDVNESHTPLFKLRGINPWGSHAFGFDLWDTDDWCAHIGQLAKMRMNFIGMHCYPEGKPYAEPTVWVGLEGDFDQHGNVRFSYPSSYFNCMFRPRWGGMKPQETDGYRLGTSLLFERGDWGPDVMIGLTPRPDTPKEFNLLFNRTGAMFRKAFTFARQVGVKTCLGTEAPLTIPKALQERMEEKGLDPNGSRTTLAVYQGMFRRIQSTYPLDYFWLWTREHWTWQGDKSQEFQTVLQDIRLAHEALNSIGWPFQLATAGWVLGPQNDRAAIAKHLPNNVAVSTLSRVVGHEPVDPAFADIRDRGKWAIPWLEDDNDGASPQLWVGRLRKDAADALAYGCTGLMGLQWRTRILGPNISALAQAGWTQSPWNSTPGCAPSPDTTFLPLPWCIEQGLVGEAGGPSSFPTTSIGHRKSTIRKQMACDDFYIDWARANFGRFAAEPVGRLFAQIDGRIPRAGTSGCPAGLRGDQRPWEQVQIEYRFVDRLKAMHSLVKGLGNIERFNYWLNSLRYQKAMGRLECTLDRCDKTINETVKIKDTRQRRQQAGHQVLPAYREVIEAYQLVYQHLLASVSTKGGLATVVYWENTYRPRFIEAWAQQLTQWLDGPLPDDVKLPDRYAGQPRLIVPTVRTHVDPAELLKLKVIVLYNNRPRKAALHWRPMGRGKYRRIDLSHVGRGVYTVTLPPARGQAIEYYILATTAEGKELVWPVTAPKLNKTVVVMPRSQESSQ